MLALKKLDKKITNEVEACMATAPASFLRQRDYLAVSFTHFCVDVLNSSRSLIVAVLAVSLGLSNTQVGLILLVYSIGNALSQPFFGLYADRFGPRVLVVGGIGWMIFFYGLAALAPPYLAIGALTVAGLGSGAFHPSGTMVASLASKDRQTQATSIFFMSGQLGLFIGPILAGVLLEQLGRSGYVILPALAFTAFLSSWKWLTNQSEKIEKEELSANPSSLFHQPSADTIRRAIFLSLIILMVGTVSISAINFAPKLFTELGYPASYVGILAGLFMLGSAVGGVVGGTLADRWNGRLVIMMSATLSILPVLLYIPAEGTTRFALLLLAGFFVGMPHSILVIMVQSLLPGQRGFGSGLALGFMFFSGALGSFVVGIIADQIGLAQTLQYTAFLQIVTIAATILLPKARKEYRDI